MSKGTIKVGAYDAGAGTIIYKELKTDEDGQLIVSDSQSILISGNVYCFGIDEDSTGYNMLNVRNNPARGLVVFPDYSTGFNGHYAVAGVLYANLEAETEDCNQYITTQGGKLTSLNFISDPTTPGTYTLVATYYKPEN